MNNTSFFEEKTRLSETILFKVEYSLTYSGWAFSGLLTDGEGGGGKKDPLPKICHTYPAMIKLGAIIPYIKKIQKMYKTHDTPLEFYLHQHFFTGNQQLSLYQEIQI